MTENNRFLKRVCNNGATYIFPIYKCVYSEEFYFYLPDITISSNSILGFTNGTCSGDPKSYQFCGTRDFANNIFTKTDQILCGYTFCHIMSHSKLFSPVSITEIDLNNETGEGYCDNQHKINSGGMVSSHSRKLSAVPAKSLCDGICDIWSCEDDSLCGNYMYGFICTWKKVTFSYIQPIEICDGMYQCYSSGKTLQPDEEYCNDIQDLDAQDICRRYNTGELVQIFNFTRCASIMHYKNAAGSMISYGTDYYIGSDLKDCGDYACVPYCQDYKDQTNCTDITKVALHCTIGGYLSSVSKMMVCTVRNLQLRMCDDGMDILCIDTSPFCTIHKHLLCNGISDCDDNSDELSETCNSMTNQSCYRKYLHSIPLSVPLSWLQDGDIDCLHAQDEIVNFWPRCGFGKLQRFLVTTHCTDVYICRNGHASFIELEKFCDGIQRCGNENEICQKTLKSSDMSEKLYRSHRNKNHRIALYCLKGLRTLAKFKISCSKISTEQLFGHKILGYPKFELTLPKVAHDCRYLYGEPYFYLSCLGYCKDSMCPLHNRKEVLRHDSCIDQYPQRIFTLVNNSALTFVVRKYGSYENDYFVCNNTYCIEYSKVCNLVDDCGDASDELPCSNHFKCTKIEQFLLLSQKCDLRIDCLDFTDECNEVCSKNILPGISYIIAALVVGTLATLFNATVIITSFAKLRKCKKFFILVNRVMIICVSVGDLSVGLYLIALAGADLIVYRNSYCFSQYKWLTSIWCSILGSLNTLGSQLSVFSMAVLSFQRASNIRNSMIAPKYVSKKNALLLIFLLTALILVSTITAITPLISNFEDYFLNGLVYDQSVGLFNGMVSKETHFNALKAHYGRMKDKILSWKVINEMVYNMFSHDYNLASEFRRKIHFYGNDGVCLFKYFVRRNDPQWAYTMALLSLNVCCFLVITISYTCICLTTVKQSEVLTKSPGTTGNHVRARNKKLRQRTVAIIATDFICWVPFVIICFLHFAEIIDATPLYSIFSIIVLPINSVINPLIYNSDMWAIKVIKRFTDCVWAKRDCATVVTLEKGKPCNAEDISLHLVEKIMASSATQ